MKTLYFKFDSPLQIKAFSPFYLEETGLFTGVVMIDLRKAFDVVDHKLLLKKLQVYGLTLTPSNGSKVTSAEGIKRYVLTVNYLNRSVFTPVYRRGVFLVLLFFCSS